MEGESGIDVSQVKSPTGNKAGPITADAKRILSPSTRSNSRPATPVIQEKSVQLKGSKTPKRIKTNIVKDIFKEQSPTKLRTTQLIEKENAQDVLTQKNIHDEDLSSESEPETKKRRRVVKRSAKQDQNNATMERRSSSRTTKGQHTKNKSSDASATSASQINVTKRKLLPTSVIMEPSFSVLLTQQAKAKIDASSPKANEETAAANDVPVTLPLKKQCPVTPGTARKRVGGEGRTASLQRILLELANLCDSNVFSDILMKAYGSRLEASKVFECLTPIDLKEAIMKKFTPSELMALIQKSGSATGSLLTMATTEAILHEVQAREELRKSEKLFNIFLQSLPNQLSNEMTKKALSNEKVTETVLHVASTDAIAKALESRADSKSSEQLFTVLLKNLPKDISEETKKSIINVLIDKFDTTELVDLSHKAIKLSVAKIQKN